MKKIYIFIVIAIICISFIVGFIINYKFFRTANDFILDDEDKYIVTTNTAIMTAISDGGTHYDVRYNVDLKNKKVIKVEDYYKGLEGYKYKNRIKFEKRLNDEEIEQIKELFNELKENSFEKENKVSGFYKLEHMKDETIKIYSDDIINKIEDLLGE